MCEVEIPSYSLLRRDRSRHGGGVLLYIRESIFVVSCERAELLSEYMHGATVDWCTLSSTKHLPSPGESGVCAARTRSVYLPAGYSPGGLQC